MLGHRGENDDVKALGRLAVREHFVFGAYLWKYLSDCLQILHTTPLEGLAVPFGVYELWPTFGSELWPFLDVLTHTSFPEQISKSTGPITVILHIHVL